MRSEEFVEWMFLEAKASREGLPVHPDVEHVALAVDESFRKMADRMAEIAEKHLGEIKRSSEKPRKKEHFWRNIA